MKKVDFLIVGGSAAGTTAADTIRSLQPNASIAIVTDEPHEFYSRVLFPHYIRGKVTREQVFLKKPEWYKEKNVDLILGEKASALDAVKKIVTLANGEVIEYGKLLISIGGYVVPFVVPGVEQANVLYMRTLDDADRILAEAKMAKKALIIGGGFIGLEFASCFRKNNVDDVKILVIEDFFWQGKIDEDSAGVITDVLLKNGVQILTKTAVDHFTGTVAVTKDGRKFEADVVGVGIGIRSDLKWLEGTGISVNRGILTNEYLETNLPDVYAAGDCAEFKDVIFERQHIVGTWANATSQGSAIGKTISGQSTVFETVSSYTVNFFDPPAGGTVSFIGVTDEKFAEQVVARGSRAEGKVTRIFVKKFGRRPGEASGPEGGVTRIVGATVVNSAADVAPLTMAIKNKVDVSAHLADLGKSEFDLKLLLSS